LIESARDNESPKRFTADIMMKRIFFIITSKYARELDPTIVLRLGSMSGEPPITPGSQKSHHRGGAQGFTALYIYIHIYSQTPDQPSQWALWYRTALPVQQSLHPS
jgi:hypothetical protein